MIQSADLSALTPTQRARVIYAQARSGMSNRLWQAAIGRADDDRFGIQAPCQHEQGGDLLGMVSALNPALGSPQREAAPGEPSPTFEPLPAIDITDAPSATPNAPVQKSFAPDDLAGLGVNSRHAPALERAAARSGIPTTALAAIIDAEAAKRSDGSWNLHSRNPRSSAAGLGQFLSGTWIGIAERPGNWLHEFAQTKGWLDGQGRVRSNSRGSLLSLRYDAEASINTIADYARSNIGMIRRAGVSADDSPAALARLAYLGHHLGPGDATRFLKGGLSENRAAHLLKAQIGGGKASARISQMGSAADAHRKWLNSYVATHIRPDRFGSS